MKKYDGVQDDLVAEAVAHYHAGRHAEAEDCCTLILKIDPKNRRILALLGTLHMLRGNPDEAIRLLCLSLQIEPRQSWTLNTLGNALKSLKRHEEALGNYEKAIQLKPDHAAAHGNRGDCLLELGRAKQALESYDEALKLVPQAAELHFGRGNALRMLDRDLEALASYDKAIELKPDNAPAYVSRARVLVALNRVADAAESYDKAIALNPHQLEAYKEGGDLCAAAHNFTAALLLYENAITLRPDFADAHLSRANVLWILRRHDEALESSGKAVALDPTLRFAPGLCGWDMNRNNRFPLPWNPLRILSGGREGPYVIGAMFTPGYSDKAARLARSCEKFGLPYVMHEVPAVHCSIVKRGTNDLSLTKPNFVHHLLERYEKPVLYVDADCEFVQKPDLVDELAKSDCDFAIYNRLADAYTDTFAPIELDLGAGPANGKRFYRFLGGVNWFSTSQLMCCGLVQFYRNSVPARFLLSEWHRTIATFPEAGDDESLRFAYNNLGLPAKALKARWLPMAYARISLWIYAEPVIDHPDHAQSGRDFRPIDDPSGRKSFYPTLTERKNVDRLFPRDCIIDTEQRMVCKLVGERLVPIKPINHPLWL